MGIQVLGPLAVEGATSIGPRDRVVLEVLVVRAGQYVAPDVLADALWGESVPASWSKVVQGCIARLRKLLGATMIETSPYGYRLAGHDDLLDVRRFEGLLARAREQLDDGGADRASYLVGEALALWRGAPLPDLGEWEPGRVEAGRLDGLRAEAEELRVAAQIAGGRSHAVVEDARGLVVGAPLRESRWALLSRALYQSGRQSEALEVIHRARRMLDEELGLEPGPELVALQEAILRQDPDLSPQPVEVTDACPYRGLLPYEADDAEAFFGRDREVATALHRLRERGVLVVVGGSGTGKSSLVRAGVVAALRAEGMRVVVTSPGARPLDSLAAVPSTGTPPVLVVDQAEETVTLCEDAEERGAYCQALAEHGGPLVVVLRADRLGELSAYPEFAAMVERGLHLLSAMREGDLREAVEGPARAAGLRLEPGLVDLLVREVLGEPGALPLLSHALRRTWERREGATLTVAGYRSTGGIRHAVAQSAESLYEQLDATEREHLRALLLRLVTPSEDGEPTRTRVPRSHLGVDSESLVEALVRARLVSSDAGDLQIAHEALAREWPRLRNWLQDDVSGQRIFRHLANAAESWDGLARPESELYRGVRLTAAAEWAARSDPELTATESAFLAASVELGDRETATAQEQLHRERQANRQLRGALVGVAVLLVAALVAGVVAVRQSAAARTRAGEARASAVSADANRLGLQSAQEHDLSTALLLALEARRLQDSPETRFRLLAALTRERSLVRHRAGGDLAGIAADPDGSTYVVSSPVDGLTSVDRRTGEVLAHREGHYGTVAFVDHETLAVGTNWSPEVGRTPHPVQLLHATTLAPLLVQPGGQTADASVNGVLTASGDGRWLAAQMDHVTFPDVATVGRTVAVWDLRHPASPVLTDTRSRDLSFAAFGEHGRLLLGWGGLRSIEVADLPRGRPTRLLELPASNGLVDFAGTTSRSGRSLAVVVDDDVALVDTRSLRTVRRWHGGPEGLGRPVLSADGTRLATTRTDADGGVVVWDTETGRQTASVGAFGLSQQLSAVFDDGGDGLVTADESGTYVWDLSADHGVAPSLPAQGVGRSVFLRTGSPDGTRMAYIDSAGALPGHFLTQVQDLRTGRIVSSAQTPKDPGSNDLQWRPDSSGVAVTDGSRVALVDATTGQVTTSPSLGLGHLNTARFLGGGGGGGSAMLVVSDAGRLARIDASTMTVARTYDVDHVMDVSPDAGGRTAFVRRDEAPYLVLDLDTGRSTELPVTADVFGWQTSPDGTRVALNTSDGLGIWDLRRGAWLRPPDSGADQMSWARDSSALVTTAGSSVTAWNGRTGAEIGTVEVGNSSQSGLAVAMPATGTRVVIAGATGDLHAWDYRLSSWLHLACDLAGRNLDGEEWSRLVGSRTYHRTCAAYPSGDPGGTEAAAPSG